MDRMVTGSAIWLRARASFVVALTLICASCAPLIAPYNETSYEFATSLKAEALMLMDKATESYDDHADDVDALMLRVEQAYEYVAGIPQNEESAAQWRILKDPNGNLLGGFMRRWESDDTLGSAFIENSKADTIGPAFDAIITLESLKIRP